MNNSVLTNHLKKAWSDFRQSNPTVRIRDAAHALGVSEAELVATNCGEGTTRLRTDWYDMLLDLEGLGEVMAMTRNDVFVHEKTGHYREASVFRDHHMGQTLDENIDLRIFFRNWHHAFAVVKEHQGELRRSLQFFDQHGTAVHKIHLRETSNITYFDDFTEKYWHEDQSPTLAVVPLPDPVPERPDSDVNRAELQKAWNDMEDTHNFIFMLRKFKVTRQQAFRVAGLDYARPVDTLSYRGLLEQAAAAELPLMIFVRNPGCVQIHSGTVKRLKEVHGWYNVLDPGFNLHVKDEEIAASWIVKKPIQEGEVHSLECFDASGNALCYIFSKRKEGEYESEVWRDMLKSVT